MQAHSFGTEELNAPPKVLADLVEAVVGAVLLDTRHDLAATWEVPLSSMTLMQTLAHADGLATISRCYMAVSRLAKA